jgi:formyl-CoA transferase
LNPLNRLYRTADGRWISLCLLIDRWFIDLARRIGREDMLNDPRYATEDAKYQNAEAMIAELSAVFEQKTIAEWDKILFGMEGVYSPCLSPAEVLNDPQALENGIVTAVTDSDGDAYMAACTPGMFDGRKIGALRASPSYGEHTDEIMRELGLADAQIAAYRARKLLM